MSDMPVSSEPSAPFPANAAISIFTDEQEHHIKKYAKERRTIPIPAVLIVEDQDFSRRLLEGMLGKQYICYTAADGQQASALYAEHIPAITFLDIELPDICGHDLAASIRRCDPDAFIVMVTANHYEKDVMRARNNKVQGFIAKPYGRPKIQAYLDLYKNTHLT